ncbi:metal tolerance protein 1 domain protein [Dictyocaulus viviparus]|uniref:Metal tolerance protein 1 domain protein n=1 Tax=Dictyocaulus viviparus TaxID=29172 RepID=A0A0D8XYB8_DICVI|nr:metal tolerance protein 1 domain protein [Dictyocaulus viviparus]
MICEVVGGLWAKSLAIVTDAAHLLTDFASILISLFSIYIAAKPPSQRMSFGFHRAEVLGAFFSVFLIWIVTGVLVVLAVLRIINQEYNIDSTVMAITAVIGVLVNFVMGIMLYFGGHSHSHSPHVVGSDTHHNENSFEETGNHSSSTPNINVRAAFIHVIGDLVQSIGVLIAALIIFFNKDWAIVDPICTLIFSVIVLCTTIYILKDAMVVLLEGRPSTIDFSNVFTSLERIKGVRKVHDLRIWALTMDKVAISVHLEVAQPEIAQSVLRETRTMLRQVYGVHESTIQIEDHVAEKDCNRCDIPK